MINLIPPIAKKNVAREYWVRTLSIWAILCALSLAVFAVLLVPTYVLLSRQLDGLALEIIQLDDENDAARHTEIVREVRAANILATQLTSQTDVPSASTVLAEIEDAQTRSIMISGFVYARDAQTITNIEVRGIAETREALVAFVDALRRNPKILHAEVPVGDLAPERSLPFSLTVTFGPTDI